VANPNGAWRVLRIAATGSHARTSLGRDGLTIEAAMTADALLDSGLATDAMVDVSFSGGTVFDLDGTGPVKLFAARGVVAGPVPASLHV
jgi:hypothetical protein